ncbi:hypothetical protein [Tardiphaga sp.]|uniref:hypothetical protein n=1 Tax=Tardiphaga sp. TaxID=1926292 RepID=UPI00260D6F99|nr:hypothetical protein [Tardiphaga sp.]MDB5619503.1 hypothetical protein [Tardiphaga sp.]
MADTVTDLAKLTTENVALRKACRHARSDLEAIIPTVEAALPGVPASGLRQTLGLIHRALALRPASDGGNHPQQSTTHRDNS